LLTFVVNFVSRVTRMKTAGTENITCYLDIPKNKSTIK